MTGRNTVLNRLNSAWNFWTDCVWSKLCKLYERLKSVISISQRKIHTLNLWVMLRHLSETSQAMLMNCRNYLLQKYIITIFLGLVTKFFRGNVKLSCIYFALIVLTCFQSNNREIVLDSAKSKHLLSANKVYPLSFFDSSPSTTCVR